MNKKGLSKFKKSLIEFFDYFYSFGIIVIGFLLLIVLVDVIPTLPPQIRLVISISGLIGILIFVGKNVLDDLYNEVEDE